VIAERQRPSSWRVGGGREGGGGIVGVIIGGDEDRETCSESGLAFPRREAPSGRGSRGCVGVGSRR